MRVCGVCACGGHAYRLCPRELRVVYVGMCCVRLLYCVHAEFVPTTQTARLMCACVVCAHDVVCAHIYSLCPQAACSSVCVDVHCVHAVLRERRLHCV